jgi:hypothetical protein
MHPNGYCVCAGEGRCSWCRATLFDLSPASYSTFSSAPPLNAEGVLADIRAAALKLDARGPVALRIEHRPGERIPFQEAGVPVVTSGGRVLRGLRVVTNPDVPPSEVWIQHSDGRVDKIVNLAVPTETP